MYTRSHRVRHYFLQDINPVVRTLILSDMIIVGAGGLLAPIFALFVEDFVVGGNAAVVGLAMAIFLFSKSVVQVPAAVIIDRIRGEKDDFFFMFCFSIAIAVLPLLYLTISLPWHLYVIQFVLGVLTAFTYPSFMAIFTRHIDHHKEGTEWSVYFTLTDISSAALAAVGGFIAVTVGFDVLIITVCALSLLGSLLLWVIKPYLLKH